MTDREKKIAEIGEAVKQYPQVEINLLETVDFLLSELERKDEENRKLREELDQQRAQIEFYKGEANLRYEWYWEQNKQLQFAQKDKEKLIEGLRWYAEGWIDSRDEGQRAREILEEIGVNVK